MRRFRLILGTLAVGLAAWVIIAPGGPSVGAESKGVWRFTLVVKETAGIRRFGYPVRAILLMSPAYRFRLLEKGKPVAAQFRPWYRDPSPRPFGGGGPLVRLDFNVSLAPHETRKYVVEYGPEVKPGPEPSRGMKVVMEADLIRVVHSPGLEFVVPRNLLGLVRSVKTAKTDYLRPGSAGLMIRYRDNILYRAGGFGPWGKPTQGGVVTKGPLAVAVRFNSTEALRGNRSVRSVVEMDFPRSKSWVRVTWTVDDPEGFVAGLGADLNLNLRAEPALVDFGAGSYVYAHLRKGQTAKLRSWSEKKATPWETLLGREDALASYVQGNGIPAEGWAHAMDRQRCTAAAVADFARAGEEGEITVSADGRLQIWKQFSPDGKPPPSGKKVFTFWLHFVGMPVQVGAVTSPQAMLAPLQVVMKSGE
jgi:hypothetical protein